jgi:ABC-type Fe2+-enterobactin transport system substrate-binding protein
MKIETRFLNNVLLIIIFIVLLSAIPVFSHPIAFTDVQGNHISITKRPLRVVRTS